MALNPNSVIGKIIDNVLPSLWKGGIAAVAAGAAGLATPVAQGNYKGAVSLLVGLFIWGALGGVGIKPPSST